MPKICALLSGDANEDIYPKLLPLLAHFPTSGATTEGAFSEVLAALMEKSRKSCEQLAIRTRDVL